MKPKVLVGCPVYSGKDYIIDRFINRIKELTYENYDILLVDNSETNDFAKKIKSLGINVVKIKYDPNSKKRLVSSRNYLREYALKNGYEYFFNLECDLIPPKDVIEQLMSHNKEVVSGWYYIGSKDNVRPCLAREWTLVDMQFTYKENIIEDLGENRLMKVFLGSFGCSLIHRSVLEKIKFRTYPTLSHHDDTWFYFDCEKNKIGVYVDTDILIPHFQDYKWDEIGAANKKEEFERLRLKEEEVNYEIVNIN
jgi:glycosyltransferase involved in cell wall biosynthesis